MGAKVFKKKLLKDYVSENVVIATNLKQTLQTETGEMAEIPVIIEGILVDFDDTWVLLGNVNNVDDTELININLIGSIKPIDPMQDAIDDLMNDSGDQGTLN